MSILAWSISCGLRSECLNSRLSLISYDWMFCWLCWQHLNLWGRCLCRSRSSRKFWRIMRSLANVFLNFCSNRIRNSACLDMTESMCLMSFSSIALLILSEDGRSAWFPSWLVSCAIIISDSWFILYANEKLLSSPTKVSESYIVLLSRLFQSIDWRSSLLWRKLRRGLAWPSFICSNELPIVFISVFLILSSGSKFLVMYSQCSSIWVSIASWFEMSASR